MLARVENQGRAIHADGDAFSVAHDPAGIAVEFDQDGAHVAQADTGRGAFVMRARSIGRGGVARRIEPAAFRDAGCAQGHELDVAGDCLIRIEAKASGVGERWESTANGLEHSFAIEARESGSSGEVVVEVGLDGARALAGTDDSYVDIASENGPMYRYSALQVRDANGRALPARFDVSGGAIRIAFDDSDAAYPVLVDPILSSTPSSSFESNQAGAGYGSAIAGAGDIDADGYDDVLVGAPSMSMGETGEGVVFVFRGSASGLTPWTTLEQNQANTAFGTSVAAAGDVNNDGYADIVVGQPNFQNGNVNEGRAIVYYGSSSGLLTAPATTTSIEGNFTNLNLGTSVASAGDVNHDGFGDVILSGPGGAGRAELHKGSATGVAVTASWTTLGVSGEQLGTVVASAGDVNRDGYADVVVASANGTSGRARVFKGTNSTAGLETVATWSAWGGPNQRFAASVASGDVNGDGADDLIVGVPGYSSNDGQIQVFHSTGSAPAATATTTINGGVFHRELGASVSSLGDLNDDGYEDILVGAPGTTLADAYGHAIVYRGKSSGIDPALLGATLLTGNVANQRFGATVAGIGDVNGDGFADAGIRVAAYSSPEPNEGQVVFHTGIPMQDSIAVSLGVTVSGATGGATVIGSAGDVDADGYDDVLVGMSLYDGTYTDEGRAVLLRGSATGLLATSWQVLGGHAGARLGDTVTAAGDINGDGYADVAVGAPMWKVGSSQRGAVLVYMGGASGLSASPTILLGTQGLSFFGASIAGGGDLDGDGYADLVVGAYGEDGASGVDEGAIYVFFGTGTGILTTASFVVPSGQQWAQLGRSIAFAGDINSDGCDEFLTGAMNWTDSLTDQGAAFVFFGQPSTPEKQIPYPLVTATGPSSGSGFGLRVAGAGDFDGDGIADVAVSLPGYSPNVGAVYVYRGIVDWPFVDTTNPMVASGAIAGDEFGTSLGLVGNARNGRSRLVVGVPGYDDTTNSTTNGGGYVVLSSENSAMVQSSIAGKSNASNSGLGRSAAGVGDTNGDGNPEFVLGANANLVGIISAEGWSPSTRVLRNLDLRVGAVSAEPGGRASGSLVVRGQVNAPPIGTTIVLEVEMRPLGTPFSSANYPSTGIVPASFATPVAPQSTIAGLAVGDYHYRARIVSRTWGRSPERARWTYGAMRQGIPNGIHVRLR